MREAMSGQTERERLEELFRPLDAKVLYTYRLPTASRETSTTGATVCYTSPHHATQTVLPLNDKDKN